MNLTEKQEIEIAQAFNKKPKNGISMISKVCQEQGLEPEEEIANFFHKQKNNLDLEAVGDYLGTYNKNEPNQLNNAVLQNFTNNIDLEGSSFTEGLRKFLDAFKLPGEAQKIDKLVESFGKAYTGKNPDSGLNQDSVYILSFATIMLSTDKHSSSIKDENKMTEEQFIKNLKGQNIDGDQNKDFNRAFLSEIYSEISKKEFKLNFVKVNPGLTLNSQELQSDAVFHNLDKLLKSSKVSEPDIQTIFPDVAYNLSAKVTKPKSFLNKLTGYEGTVILTDERTKAEITIEVYKPNIISKYLFGNKPKVTIQPSAENNSLELAAKVAASFSSNLSSVKTTYEYEAEELKQAYEVHRNKKEIRKEMQIITQKIKSSVLKPSSSINNSNLPNKSSSKGGVVR